MIPVNTSVCFVLSFADRRRLYLRCDTRGFFSLKINKNLHQANVQNMLNVSHYHHLFHSEVHLKKKRLHFLLQISTFEVFFIQQIVRE